MEGSNASEGNGFNTSYVQLSAQRVSITRMYVVIEVVAGQRTTRHHWPIFVFTGAVKENLHAVVRGNAACKYVDPHVIIFSTR